MAGKPKLELSATQLVASAAATVTATVAASYFGVSGTIIGAGVVSVLSTAGAAVYRHALDRSTQRIAARIPGRTGRRTETTVLPEAADLGDTVVDRLPVVGDRSPRPRWYVLAGTAAGIFVVVIGLVTALQLFTGGPLARAVQGKADQGGPVHPGMTRPSPTAQPSESGDVTPSTPSTQVPGPGEATSTTPTESPSPSEPPLRSTPTPSSGDTSQPAPAQQPTTPGTPTGPAETRPPGLRQPPPLG
jgi:hypothetical protein